MQGSQKYRTSANGRSLPTNSYFDIEALCNQAVERTFRGEPNSVGAVISQATYDLVWQTFTRWCQGQADQGRAVNLSQFGIIGHQKIRDNFRILHIKLSDYFLKTHQLQYQSDVEFRGVITDPLTKPNFAPMAKLAQIDKETFATVLGNITHVLGELLSEGQSVDVDLGEMGKFRSSNRQIIYDPFNKLKPQAPQGKQTVKALMDQGTGKNSQFDQYQQQYYAQQQYMPDGMYGTASSKGQSMKNMVGVQGDSPTRRYKKPFGDGKITKDLLGAGDDPMAKNQEFSLLAGNPHALMKQTFKKPGKAQSRYPPVIDAFSRTLAAPISSERHYFSVCHKIGTNFTPTTKGFFIDSEARIIKFKQMGDNGTKLDIVGSGPDNIFAMVEPADEQEEYEALIYPQNADKRRIQARKVSYARYRQYVENEISVDVIAPIRQYWLTHIIELIPGDLHAVEKERIEYLIDTMLNEINKDYFDSVRKSILDYILKDQGEMKRLGIQQVLNQPIDWGNDYYKGIEPNEEWKHNVMMARMLMSENLCICSQATLELMKLWQDYKNYLFISLPPPRSEPLALPDFLSQQEQQGLQVKQLLNTQWNKSAVDILREELETLNKDKDQTKHFFDSAATLMANQVRELIEQSVHAYVTFIERFKMDKYPEPAEIIDRNYDPDSPLEDNFILLRLKTDDKRIIFHESYETIQQELVGIVTNIVNHSQNLPRPETTMSFEGKHHLWEVKNDDKLVIDAKEKISVIISDNLETAKLALQCYNKFLFILNEQERISEILNKGNFERNALQEEINKYNNLITQIRNEMPQDIRMNMFLIRCADINQALCDKCQDLIDLILNKINDHAFQNLASQITNDVKRYKDEMGLKCLDSQSLVKSEKRLEEIKNIYRPKLILEYNDMIDWLSMLNNNPRLRQTEDQMKPVSMAFTYVNEISFHIENAEKKLREERKDIEKGLSLQIKEFNKNLEETAATIKGYEKRIYVSANKHVAYQDEIRQTIKKLGELTEEMAKIHEQQADLEILQVEYPLIDTLKEDIEPHRKLWDLQVEYDSKYTNLWNQGALKTLNPDDLEADFRRMFSIANNLVSKFSEKKSCEKSQGVAKAVAANLDEFRPYMPIIRSLCHPGLHKRKKRVEEIMYELGLAGQNNKLEDQSVNSLKKVNVLKLKEKLDEISEFAVKESSNEATYNKMKADWEPLAFECKSVAGKDSYILDGEAIELIQTALDDHIIKTQTMKSSPYAEFMIKDIEAWEKILMRTQENLDLWLKVQAVWMYLEPVFSSEDIISQMPIEGSKFKEVNYAWHNLMNRVNDKPDALTVIKIEELGTILKSANEKLERVQKGLNEYLESKRTLFPRFYFLSNDEMLEILSETKEPLRVQPHLSKCFEGIAGLNFQDDKKIDAMKSIEGEEVPFVEIIDPIAAKGAVELWLLQVEVMMIRSIRNVIEQSYQDYTKQSRDKWVIKWTGQAVLAVSMMFWTMQSEEAMKKNGLVGLQQYYDRLNSQLIDTVGVVRTPINKLQRCTLQALIVLDVHARDVIREELVDKQICDPNDFAWLSQLRYYWEDNNVWVKIINNRLEYNYEYLGNSDRLVITPLTDRCYRTLCGAIYLNYGGAPEGPAGTGKTETVKDLAKSLARYCKVFNCSDGLDYVTMGKFFKGLASCGAWSCFDEFNRIELEVLSVVAQQVQSIQMAIEKKKERFFFEDTDLPIKHTCNCFITMNPGYAGRSELPDNLKALFRSVAMMVPDYTMIARISLYSFGFVDAQALALKITTTYKLCSEQLSSQDHYDYGMRAVKSVLTAAGNLKKRYMDENESILMLRAINEVNLAKFLSHDLPLFKNITSDLFPGVVLPEPDYKQLIRCIKNQMDLLNLQHHPYMIMKILQLYEMILVRHGLMIVGLPFCGKSTCLKVLQNALTQLNSEKLMDEMKTHIQVINPKSITMGQLYGNFDDVSHDWFDGVLAVEYRRLAAAMSIEDRRWLIFDGPVDAIWIENMNTVLDDNKKLCLMNSEVISMTANMNMIFEPMDLAAASPATVSRCGMVYLQPHEMGWMHLYTSWCNLLPTTFGDEQKKEMNNLVQTVVQYCIDFIRKECKETTPTEDQNLVVSLLRIWRTFLKYFEDEKNFEAIDKKQVIAMIGASFIFSCVWSVCVSINTEFRKPFDIFFKKVCNGELENMPQKLKNKVIPSVFDRQTIYDYCYNIQTHEWKHWMDLVDKEKCDNFPVGSIPQEIIVTTAETVKYSHLQKLFIMNNIRSLFVGPTGTGKTKYIQNLLSTELPESEWLIINVGFSAQTNCNQVQDIIDLKVEKIRKDQFGPRFGMKGAVVFVDDLNMPKKETYGAQPPIEILRQLVDQGGWYDRGDKKHPFRNIINTNVIAAMGTPGGGRSFITPRFQRHFNIIAFANFDDASLKNMFSSLLKWHFRVGGFVQEVASMEQKIVAATLKVYENIQADLKPTPAKTHYTFNLRDFSKVICGMTAVNKKDLLDSNMTLRLWAHEISRVFGDRLINNEDRMWMLDKVRETTRAPFGAQFDSVFAGLDTDKNGKVETLDEFRGLLFGDIYTPFGISDRPYVEIDNKQKLQQCADEALGQYNQQSDKPMPLVLFNFAIEHLLRIGRILKQPGGHALLVGVGGSGRQSLSRLASRIADFDVFQVEIKKNYRMQEWREDIKTMMKQVGKKGNPTSFLFTDTQIKQESFLEDVNNILNTGEVPNIFPTEDKVEIASDLVNAAREDGGKGSDWTPTQFFTYFLERCKKYLHIVLCFSPIGSALAGRIRDFPAIVNCTTIDWFSEWPPDALQAVAQKFLSEIKMTEAVRENCVQMVQTFHTTTQEQAIKFKAELGRIYYVTPTSYLELINTFKSLLAEKRKEIMDQKNRYANGFTCLINTEQNVFKMQKELEELQPVLVTKGIETEEQLKIVSKEEAEATIVKDAVAIEEADAKKSFDAADTIRQDCQRELAAALPALKSAQDALNCITQAAIAQMKGFAQPPQAVKNVLKVVCFFLDVKPISSMNPQTMKKELDYWKPSVTMMQDNFLKKLQEYPKEEITQELIDKIQPDITHEDFTVEKITKVSDPAGNIAKWVFAMDKYFNINKIVKPKQEQLKVAEGEAATVKAKLDIKQAELKAVVDKLEAKQSSLRRTLNEKQELEDKVEDCKAKLIRAESLITGLGGEKTRWKAESERLGIVYDNLTGDVLISSGMIAYLGAFTSVYRENIAQEWVKLCEAKEIPNSGKFSLERVLGNQVTIRNWALSGLPNDAFSVENAIITDKTRRWPLFIDPQGQANRWIKNMEKEKQIRIMKFSDGNYLKLLEASIRMGTPVLMENIGEELDPAIEPLLQKQISVKGGSMTIKIGDSVIEYAKEFKFYMTTKYRNPHYLPEVSTKVTILNFVITFEGLSDQLLGIVVEKENPELQTKKEALVIESAQNKNQLSNIEDQILHTLQNSKDILGDAQGIQILQNANQVSAQINVKQAIAEKTEIEIDEARKGYKPVAMRTSGLFFCISDLANIDPMYQYSLDFFKGLFVGAIADSEKSDDLEERLGFLNQQFLESLYRNICRSLFEKDKLLFSCLLTIKLMEMAKEIDPKAIKFFLTGGVSLGEQLPNNPTTWLSEKSWGEMNRLTKIKGFEDLVKDFIENHNFYKKMYDSLEPQNFQLSAKWQHLDKFQFMLVLRCIRPDLIVPSIANFVTNKIGDYFITPPPFELSIVFKDSGPTIPLIFVLSPGADPLNSLDKYAQSKKKEIKGVSLGQGQGPKAEKLIAESQKTGDWVVLQNCHLAVSWMGNLEKLCEDMPLVKPHREFRLWLTSYPSESFPVAVLQNGVKMTNEPPAGLKQNLIGSFGTDPISNRTWFDSSTMPKIFRKMLFGLCFFHAFIQERRNFGPLGWNIQYQFNESDLRISARQLLIFIDDYPDAIPLDALNYLTGECNYGGRVTDDKDRRLMSVVLKIFFCKEIFEDDDYKFSPSGIYYAPKHTEYDGYIDFIKGLPTFADPEIFGFHPNAAITKNQNQTNEVLNTILITMSSAGGSGGGSGDEIINTLADSILKELPALYDVKAAEKKFPVSYEQSMNTVLTQELDRFNNLIKVIRSSLQDLKKAIKGEVLLSADLEAALNSLKDGAVPAMWIKKSYPSLKSLGGYIKDLLERLAWFKKWQDTTIPKVMWITRYFFTQGFLTGAKQNYARKYKIAIDLLDYDFEVMNMQEEDVSEPPDEGIYVTGMFLEGCKWNSAGFTLDESDPKILFDKCPMVWFKPCKPEDFAKLRTYDCPIYKTSVRKGVLMTTGHSTNFVLLMRLPSKVPPEHWIMRGVAIICSLDD